MARLKHSQTGVVIEIGDDKKAPLGFEPAGDEKKTASKRASSSSKSDEK